MTRIKQLLGLSLATDDPTEDINNDISISEIDKSIIKFCERFL